MIIGVLSIWLDQVYLAKKSGIFGQARHKLYKALKGTGPVTRC